METISVVKDGRLVFSAKVSQDLASKTLDFAKGLGGELSSSYEPKKKVEKVEKKKKEESEEPENDF